MPQAHIAAALTRGAGRLRARERSSAAILGQPLDYLHAVWLDTIRLFDPHHPSYGDYSPDQPIAFMLGGFPANSGKNEFVEFWASRAHQCGAGACAS